MSPHVGANWSGLRTLASPVNLSPSGVKCGVETAGPPPIWLGPKQPGDLSTCCPPFTPPSRCCVEQLFTFRSGYTCGCAMASLVKPKRWPGILSFDPCVKGTLVTRLHWHDWPISLFLCFFVSLFLCFFLCFFVSFLNSTKLSSK